MFLLGNSVSGKENCVSRQCGGKTPDALKEQHSTLRPEQGEMGRVTGDDIQRVTGLHAIGDLSHHERTWSFTLHRIGRHRQTWQESDIT